MVSVSGGSGGRTGQDSRHDEYYSESESSADECDHGGAVRSSVGTAVYHRLYRSGEISDFPAVFLPGESGADGKAVRACDGICRSEGRRDSVGSLLRDWDDFPVFGAEGGESVRSGDRIPGGGRRQEKCGN